MGCSKSFLEICSMGGRNGFASGADFVIHREVRSLDVRTVQYFLYAFLESQCLHN